MTGERAGESEVADAESEVVDSGPEAADSESEDTAAILDELFAVVEDRKETLPEDSYTASLFSHEKGENAVLEKLGEETTELLLAAKDDDREEIAHESADIVYHLLVLLSMKDMDLADLRAELRERR
jgi:phosphoribosyl-ATP pyrophosphohydrolase